MDEAHRAILIRRVKQRLKWLAALIAIIVVILLAIYFIAPQWILRAVDAYQAQQAGLTQHAVQAGNTRWVYDEGGKGPTILLLHGFTGSRENWLKVAGRLTPNFRVVIPDLPGWGASQRIDNTDYGAPAQAKRLAAFIDALQLDHIVLVGHSMGGLIAGLYATQHPDKIAAIGFIDSDGVGYQRDAGTTDPFAYADRAGFERMMKLAFDHPPSLPGRIEDVFVARNRARLPMVMRTFEQLRAPAQAHGLEPVLPKINVPTWILWCHDDKIIDPQAVEVFRKNLTGAPRIDVTMLFGCSHMPMLEKPDATAQALIDFLLPHAPMPAH